jgi:hypothetical protein
MEHINTKDFNTDNKINLINTLNKFALLIHFSVDLKKNRPFGLEF